MKVTKLEYAYLLFEYIKNYSEANVNEREIIDVISFNCQEGLKALEGNIRPEILEYGIGEVTIY